MEKCKLPKKLKKCFEIKTKKDVFLICVFIILLLVLAFCIIERKQIVKEITVLRYEKKYKQTQDCSDLVDLVMIMQNSIRKNDKIKYSKILVNNITEDGIRNSLMAKEEPQVIDNLLELETPFEFAVNVYFRCILNSKEYDLYITEFVDIYPKLSYEMRIVVDAIAPDSYSRAKDINALKAGVKANRKLLEITDDELLSRQCDINAENLETIISEIESSSSNKLKG